MRFDFTLTGVTPLLIHADNIEMADLLTEWRKDPKNKNQSVPGDDRSPPWSWQCYLYLSDKGQFTIPSELIMAAIRYAGARVILKKQLTFKSLSQSGLLIDTEFCDFAGPKGSITLKAIEAIRDKPFAEQSEAVKALGFTLYTKRAKVGQGKHIRVRARFDQWTVRGQIEIVDPDISADNLRTIFHIAGDKAGLCDWRPSAKQSPGPHGRFSVDLKVAA